MKRTDMAASVAMAMTLFFVGILICHSEDPVPGEASDFSAVQYFPNSQQIQTRTSGSSGSQISDTVYLIKNFKLESFAKDGQLSWVATAPECQLNQANNQANSSSHLVVISGNGKSRLEGDGFLWRQDNSLLSISNHLVQVIESSFAKAGSPLRPRL
jgi:hypothetical protein